MKHRLIISRCILTRDSHLSQGKPIGIRSSGLFAKPDLCSCGQGGIGEALVTEYTRQGLHAIATVLPNEDSDHLSKAGITFYTLDVTSEKSILELKADVQKLTGGRLDVLVNCA